MQFLIPVIVGALITAASTIVGRVLIALGIGLVTYTGISASLNIFKSYFISYVGSAGYGLSGIAGVLKLDICLSMIIATGLAKMTIKGATNGSMIRFTLK